MGSLANPPIKSFGVVLRPSTPSLKDYFLELKKILEKEGFCVSLDSLSGSMIGLLGTPFNELCRQCDALLSIGGDGTLIATARRAFGHSKPILGINMGHLGFLTDLNKDEVASILNDLKQGNYLLAYHMMLEGTLADQKPFYALNDIILTRSDYSSMIQINGYVLEEDSKARLFNAYNGDGLIIATPTGSTAYNISAGGAVVYPYSYNLLVTPICPHSLTQRPLILPGNFKLEFKLKTTGFCRVIIDGQEIRTLHNGESIQIGTIKEGAMLIHNTSWNYFNILKEKFKWGDF